MGPIVTNGATGAARTPFARLPLNLIESGGLPVRWVWLGKRGDSVSFAHYGNGCQRAAAIAGSCAAETESPRSACPPSLRSTTQLKAPIELRGRPGERRARANQRGGVPAPAPEPAAQPAPEPVPAPEPQESATAESGWNVAVIPGAATEAPAGAAQKSAEGKAATAAPAGPSRYGEAVVRELLNASFIEETTLAPRDRAVPLPEEQ